MSDLDIQTSSKAEHGHSGRRRSTLTQHDIERLTSVLGKSKEAHEQWQDPASTGCVDAAKHADEELDHNAYWWIGSIYASWVCLSLLVGALCGMSNTAFHKMLLGCVKWIRVEPAWYIAERLGFDWWPVIHYTLTTIVSGMVICKARESFPGIASGGFVNVKLCILQKSYISPQVGLQRMLATSLYIGGGAPLGAEAPTLHVSSAVACTVYRAFSSVLPVSFPKFAMPQIVIAGCACGMAAAYNSPLGGTLHAMEEFMDSSSSQVAIAFLAIGSVASVWMVRVVEGRQELWSLHPTSDSSAELHPWMLVSIPFGLFLGLLGALFVKTVELLRAKWKSSGVSPMKTMIASALVTSACGICVHLLTAGEGHICSPKAHLDFLRSWNAHQSYPHGPAIPNPSPCSWSLGMEIWGMSTDLLQLHMSSDPPLAPLSVVAFCFFKCVAVVFAIASNGSGGAFTPSLVLGGCFGAALHSVLRLCLYGDLTDNPDDAEQFRICIIMGMAGFFSSVVRLPLCGTLVSVEMVAYASLGDRNTTLCFPILFCCMTSYVTAVCFSPHTLFEILLAQDGISEHDMESTMSDHADPFPRTALSKPPDSMGSNSLTALAKEDSGEQCGCGCGGDQCGKSCLEGNVDVKQVDTAETDPATEYVRQNLVHL